VPVSVQRPKGLGTHLDIPFQATVQNPILIGSEASGEAQSYFSSFYVHSDPQVTSIGKQLGAEMKPKIATLVENLYGFKTSQAHNSISHNAKRAQELLRDMNFTYPVRLHHTNCQSRNNGFI
jgi:hypothetical protein